MRRTVTILGGAAFGLAFVLANSAQADCAPDPATSGATVTCDSIPANDTDGFAAGLGVNTLDVTVVPGATVDSVGDGLNLNDGNTVTNSGTIGSTAAVGGDGIQAGDGNTISNTGAINATDDGVEAVSNTSITNSGTITGGDNGIEITGTGTNTVDNSGTLTGTNLALRGGSGVENVTNRSAATINGDVDLGGGDDSLTLESNSVLNSNIVDGGLGSDALTLDDAGAYAGRLTNFENLSKQGAGTWTLSGGPSDVANTAITAGTLAVDGFLSSTVTIGAGATFAGNGTADGDVSNGGGTVAPGNSSIGTLTVTGNYAETAPSTLSVEIDDAGNSDLLHVLGTATIDPGSTLSVLALAGDYTLGGKIYNLLIADGGRSGVFGTITAAGTIKLFLDYQADRLQMTSIPASFGSLGATANQRSLGLYLNSSIPFGICESDLCFVAAQLGLSGNVPAALDQVHPEVYDAYVTAGFTQARMFTDAVSGQLGDLRRLKRREQAGLAAVNAGPPRGFASVSPHGSRWLRAIGGLADKDNTSQHVGYDYHTFGGVAGFDYQLGDQLLLGAAVGGSHTAIDWDGRTGDGQATALQTGIYTSYFTDRYHLDGVVGYGHNWFDTERGMSFGAVTRTADSDHKGHQIMAQLEAGSVFHLGRRWILEPVTQLEYVHLIHGGFTESGAGGISLAVDSRKEHSLRAKSFLKLSRPFEVLDWVVLMPEARVGTAHEFLDNDRQLTASFAGLGSSFSVDGDDPSKSSVLGGFSLTVLMGERVSLVTEWNGEFRSDHISNAMSAGVHVSF